MLFLGYTKHMEKIYKCTWCRKQIPENSSYCPKCRHKLNLPQKTHLKNYRERHKKLGLCIKCSEKVLPGHVLCKRHLNYQKECNRKFKAAHQ
jgi:DNA-directed RNA polymerase subunit RPC12/RpoP